MTDDFALQKKKLQPSFVPWRLNQQLFQELAKSIEIPLLNHYTDCIPIIL